MPIERDTTMSRSPLSTRRRLSVTVFLLIVALAVIASAQSRAAGPRGEIEDRIFANGFEEGGVPYEPPVLIESHASPGPGGFRPGFREISIPFRPGSHDPGEIRLLIDGEDVTDGSVVTPHGPGQNRLKYALSAPAEPGFYVIEARIATASYTWVVNAFRPDTVTYMPEEGAVLPAGSQPTIGLRFGGLSGRFDPESVRLFMFGPGYLGPDPAQENEDDDGPSGVDLTPESVLTDASIEYRPSAVLENSHNYWVHFQARDRFVPDTVYRISWFFSLGPRPRVIAHEPGSGVLPMGSTPTLRIHVASEGYPLRSHALHYNGYDFDKSELTISIPDPGVETQIEDLGNGTYLITHTPTHEFVPLRSYCYSLYATNELGLSNEDFLDETCFQIDQDWGREVEILTPQPDAVVATKTIEVRVRGTAQQGERRKVTIQGEIASAKYDYSVKTADYLYDFRQVELTPGENLIDIEIEFDGVPERHIERRQLRVYFEPAPEVEIDTPSDWQSFGPVGPDAGSAPGDARNLTGAVQRPIRIEGRTSAAVQRVEINQQSAVVSPDGRSFEFNAFFLHEGSNLITATATDAQGRSGSTSLSVYVDQTAPLLTVESPTPESVTSLSRIDVRGLVNDAVQAPVETAAPRVRVRNQSNDAEVEAVVGGLGYVAEDLPLEVGLNRLDVTALDQHGNARSRSVEIVRTLTGSGRLVALSGNRQYGSAGSLLPQPLVVQAFDADGEPMTGVPVHVDVVRGSGSIHQEQGPDVVDGVNPPRNLVLNSDAQGLVLVWLHLGVDSRPGSDVVRFWSPGLAEEAVFSATAEAGVPASVHIYGSSGTQYVAVDSTPIEALMVQVHDARDNPIPDTLVEFRIESGEAVFTDRSAPGGVISEDGRTITVQADRNGVAVVRPQSGETPGTVRVQADALTETGERIGTVGFHLVVLERQDGPTRLAGTVLDHTGIPLAGVRLSIGRTVLSVLSDEAGYFEFAGQVPPGKVDLFVDGRNVRFHRGSSLHEYPALHFEASVIQGQLNQLPHPIYLPPIDLGQTQIVGGDNEVALTLPGFEGFEMRVKANSVTFPDGSRIGPLAIAPVHNDRLPMVPLSAAGRFETVGWTIQPTNTRFDPPIEVRIPNTSGLRPGQTIPIQQWDHDLALFVPMGNGTVSEDGTVIVSDPGSGITKAGWGGGPPPPPPNTGENQCPGRTAGTRSTASLRITVDGQTEFEGALKDPLASLSFAAEVLGNCQDPQFTWYLGDGSAPQSGQQVQYTYEQPGRFPVQANVTCSCGEAVPPATTQVRLFCDLTYLDGADQNIARVRIVEEQYIIKSDSDISDSFTSFIRPTSRPVKFEAKPLAACKDHIEASWSIDGQEHLGHVVESPLEFPGRLSVAYEIRDCEDCEPSDYEKEFTVHACSIGDRDQMEAQTREGRRVPTAVGAGGRFLFARDKTNREHGGGLYCREGGFDVRFSRDSPGDDYCKIDAAGMWENAIASLPHTHPYFTHYSTNHPTGGFIGGSNSQCRNIYDSVNIGRNDTVKRANANRGQQAASDGDKRAARAINGFHLHGWGRSQDCKISRLVFWDPLMPSGNGDPRLELDSPGCGEYVVRGVVEGLRGSGLVLRNQISGDEVQVTPSIIRPVPQPPAPPVRDVDFVFNERLPDVSNYDIVVQAAPQSPRQNCQILNGSGVVQGADVTNVSVICAVETFSVGGEVIGLTAAGLVLQNNAGDDLAISADGSFAFATPLEDGSGYAVTVRTQPSGGQDCQVVNGSGTVSGGPVTGIEVLCEGFTIGGTVSGLEGVNLTLENNGGDRLRVETDGPFVFPTPVADGANYSVTVARQPTSPAQDCVVSRGAGSVDGGDVTDVAIDCGRRLYSIGGTVTGLSGTGLRLRNNAVDEIEISSDGTFVFPTRLPDHSVYQVVVAAQPSDPGQVCTVSNGANMIAGGDIENVRVICVAAPQLFVARNLGIPFVN